MRADTSTPAQRYKICQDKVVAQIIDDEAIIINMENGCYYSLDSTGAAIWRAIEQAIPMPDIAKILEARYDCSAVDVLGEVGKLLLELEAEQLVEPLSEGSDWKGGTSEPNLQQGKEGESLAFKSPRFEKHSDMQDFLLVDPIHQVDDRGWPHKDNS